MGDSGNNGLEKSPVSDNQDTMVDVFLGVFFDGIETDLIKAYRANLERQKDEIKSDIQNSSVYGTVNEYSGYAKSIADQLPPNPVSNVVNTAVETKEKIEGAVWGAVDTVEALVDNNFGLGSVSSEFVNDGDDLLSSDRSSISKIEPRYRGDIINAPYNFRFYVLGAVSNDELRNKPDAPELGADFIEQSVRTAKEAIEDKINSCPRNLHVHFDVFGFGKDPAVKSFIPEIEGFRQMDKVDELTLEFTGIYDNYHSMDEVKSSLGEVIIRFSKLD